LNPRIHATLFFHFSLPVDLERSFILIRDVCKKFGKLSKAPRASTLRREVLAPSASSCSLSLSPLLSSLSCPTSTEEKYTSRQVHIVNQASKPRRNKRCSSGKELIIIQPRLSLLPPSLLPPLLLPLFPSTPRNKEKRNMSLPPTPSDPIPDPMLSKETEIKPFPSPSFSPKSSTLGRAETSREKRKENERGC